MGKFIIHKAGTRGHAKHGWLDSHHTFSFANYYNPDRINFGTLRVLNDDIVEGGMGFGIHPHNDMEIVTIPLEGTLEHKDSLGNVSVIEKGEIQIMSAGTGITHSEYNKNSDKPAKFLQIWVFPDKKGYSPRYDQINLDKNISDNSWQEIISPHEKGKGAHINQEAWFNLGDFFASSSTEYALRKKGNGIYIFVISGDVVVGDIELNPRDGLGVWETEKISMKFISDSELLVMEVPMEINR